MKTLYNIILFLFIKFEAFCCGDIICCCNQSNFKDNEFCFLAGRLDPAKVIIFMKDTTEIINKIENEFGVKLSKIDNLVNLKSKNKLKNKPSEVAIKNFIAFCEILFLLSRSYNLIKFLNEKILTKEENEENNKKKEEYNNKKTEYLSFLDEAVSKTLAKKINKNESTTNINDLVKQVSKKCSDCFSIILYNYIYGIDEETIKECNKSDEDYLDCLVSYISETPNLILL